MYVGIPSIPTQTIDITDRTKRVREARDEAKKEIETYRSNKEAEYKEFEAQVLRTFGTTRVKVLTLTAHTREQGGRG